MTLACLLPAAGASSRMRGGDKLLQSVEGKPCLQVMAERARAAGMQVIVTLPDADHPRASALAAVQVTRVVVPDAAQGMSASLRAGVLALPAGITGLMILPPDMPALTTNDLRRCIAVFQTAPQRIVQATTEDGDFGHPILFPADLLDQFQYLSGDRGAAPILKAHADRITPVALAGQRARLDLDTPEDWASWRATQGKPPLT